MSDAGQKSRQPVGPEAKPAVGGQTAGGAKAVRAPAARLQAGAGNQAVQRLVGGGLGQFAVGRPGDPLENQARRNAGQGSMTSPAGGVPVQPGRTAYAGARVGLGGGAPLPVTTRRHFEGRFNADFTAVRVHSGSRAASLADSLHAEAFTLGSELVFGAGRYAPDTRAGRGLIAHELTHVLQQSQRGQAFIQRNGHHGAPALPEGPSPEEVFNHNAQQLMERGLPRFRTALDNVSESAVRDAGMYILVLWHNIRGSYLEMGGVIESEAPPPAVGSAPAAPTPPAPAPAAPAPPVTTTPTVTEAVRQRFEQVQRAVRINVSTQGFKGQAVLGSYRLPEERGDLGQFILRETGSVAWVVKDTADLISLLGSAEALPEADQWRAIGLLRQHQNPWHFAYMLAAVQERGLRDRFSGFATGPARFMLQILQGQHDIREQGLVGPSERLGLVRLLPAESKAVLLQPMTPAEVAARFYGNAERWSTHLAPYNRGAVGGAGGHGLLSVGTEILLDPALLVDEFRPLFLYAQQTRRTAQEGGTEPYIRATPDTVAVVGNTIRYSIMWPNAAFADHTVQWSIDNDPAAVREEGVPAHVERGQQGVLSWGGESHGTSVELEALAPGNHTIRCRLTSQSTGDSQEVTYTQVVMSLEQRTELVWRQATGLPKPPGMLLADLREERGRMTAANSTREQREAMDDRIRHVEELLQEQSGAYMRPMRAVYVSAGEAPVAVQLAVYVGADPAYGSQDRGYHLMLWDMSMQGAPLTKRASGERVSAAFYELLRSFSDDAPYPDGNIRFEITPLTLLYTGLVNDTVTYPTDGGTLLDDVLRGLSTGALVIGVGAAFLGQVEVAVPALVISGLLAGGAAGLSIAERLEHGQFEWDWQAALDVMDIAGALLSLGMSRLGTATARGVGRMTFVAQTVDMAQIGIVGGLHLTQISAAVESGDRERVAQAVANAVRDGAIYLVVHRAGARIRAGEVGPGLTGRPAAPDLPPGTAGEAHTMAGTTRGGGPPTGEPGAPGHPTAAPGTPEYFRQTHAQQLATLGTAPHQPGTIAVSDTSPVGRGTFRTHPHDQFGTAYQSYQEALARSGGREVGIYRNVATGEYVVRVGDTMGVGPPPAGNWEGVLHYHPNTENVLTYRMPAPQDIQVAAESAWRANRPMTEFVEYPLPGGQRGRAMYHVDPSTGRVTVEFTRPGGDVVRREYDSLSEYQDAYFSRTFYVDPDSPEYQWIVRDIHDYYRYSQSGTLQPQHTMAGAARPTGAQVERMAIQESMTYWQGRETDTTFARHQQTFTSLAATLRNKAAALVAAGRGTVLPSVNEAVLNMPVDEFIRRTPALRNEWNAIRARARDNPQLRAEMQNFLEGRRGGGARLVGSRQPDIVEFFLDSNEVVVTDITTDLNSPVHRFKTRFYREVLRSLMRPGAGINVYGLDINPAVQPPASVVVD